MRLWERVISKIFNDDISLEIKPPDLIIHAKGVYSVIRYLIALEVDYSVSEIDETRLRSIVETYSSLLDKLPEASEIKVVKIGLNHDDFLKRLTNEMLNLKATIDVVEEPHVRDRSRVRLKILENIYEAILRGKRFTQLILVIKIRDYGRDLDEIRKRLSVISNIAMNVFRNEMGIVFREANLSEIKSLIKYELGLDSRTRCKSIVLDSSRLGCLAPIPRFKKPRYGGANTLFLGYDLETGWVVELPVETLDKHLLVLGPTGRGKTTFLASLIESLVCMSDIRVFGLDFKGDLASLLNGTLDIVKPSDYPINILVKPSVFDSVEWVTSIADALSNILGLEKHLVMEILVKNSAKERNGFDDALKRRLLIASSTPELFTAEPKYDELIKLMSRNIVFDLNGYGSSFQNLYASVLIHIYRKIIISKHCSLNSRSVLIIDEAWRVSRLRGLVELVKEGRSRGVGVVLASQNPSDIPREIVENTNTIVMFGSVNEDYHKDAQKILGITPAVAKKLSHLGIGEAIVINALNPHYVVLKVRPPVALSGTRGF